MSDPLGAPSRSSLVMGTIVVVAAIIVTGALFAWLALDDGTESLSERGPATPKALAAMTVEVLAIEPDSYDVVHETQTGAAAVSMSADGNSFEVSVSEDDGEEPDCEVMDGCDHWDEAGGTVWLRWQEQEPEEDPGIVYVTWVGDGEVHEVRYAGVLIEPDPREQDLPVSVDRMVDLVTDPRMGLTMPVYLEDTELDGWPEGGGAQSPRELAPIDPQTFAAWSVGADLLAELGDHEARWLALEA